MFEHGFHGERVGDFAMGIVEALVAILVGALFMVWLSSSHPNWRTSSDLGRGCGTLGRGGNPCVAHSERNESADRGSQAERDCASFGKGGRLCFSPQRVE